MTSEIIIDIIDIRTSETNNDSEINSAIIVIITIIDSKSNNENNRNASVISET
jgi:hypothetical protein